MVGYEFVGIGGAGVGVGEVLEEGVELGMGWMKELR